MNKKCIVLKSFRQWVTFIFRSWFHTDSGDWVQCEAKEPSVYPSYHDQNTSLHPLTTFTTSGRCIITPCKHPWLTESFHLCATCNLSSNHYRLPGSPLPSFEHDVLLDLPPFAKRFWFLQGLPDSVFGGNFLLLVERQIYSWFLTQLSSIQQGGGIYSAGKPLWTPFV